MSTPEPQCAWEDRDMLARAISDTSGNIRQIASIFGCSRQNVYNWIARLKLKTALKDAREGR